MCLRSSYRNPEAAQLRRKATVLAGGSAGLASLPAISSHHHHMLITWACIAVQIVCIVMAMRLIVLAKRIERGT